MKKYLWIILLVSTTATAQKLPNVQTASLRAPATIKINGKATEWDNKFEAYNNTTEVFYTLANDNQNLYLLLQATDETIIKKIAMGGVTLTVNTGNQRDIKNAAAFTFPTYDSSNPASYFKFAKPKTGAQTNMDSLMNMHNNTLTSTYKFIGIAGVEAIKDSLLAIYNKEEIMASAKFDNKLNYTYEMAIPLKYLNLNKASKFTYNIKLNAATIDGRKLEMVPGRNIVVYTGANGVNYMLDNNPRNLTLVAPTDFWGEYTLTK